LIGPWSIAGLGQEKRLPVEMQEDESAGRSSGNPPGSPEKEIAHLKAEIAFLQKKLQLVGSVTRHDVLNQLTAVVGYNELLGMMVEDEKLKSFLEKERQSIDKIRRQFQFAKDYQNLLVEPPRWQTISMVVHLAREEAEMGTIRITDLTGTASILADPLLDRAFIQIFDNTVRHGGGATEIRISVKEEGPSALLVIEDNGPGIPAAEKEKIFERGYGKGTGWGLFLAREILEITGITLVENGEPGRGARFVLTLPAGTFRPGSGA
jgi:signal transduction histidine kinase